MAESGSKGTLLIPEPPTEARASKFATRPMRFDRRRHDRIRFALHDRLGPALANLELRMSLLEEAAGTTGCSKEEVTSLRLEVTALVEELRRIVHGELPKPLELGDLAGAMREACRRTSRPGLDIDFTVSGAPFPLPWDVAELLYRAVLEGTANVARHARARRCLVKLSYSGSFVSLEVRDNGQGADGSTRTTSTGLGLTSLASSARRLGGAANLESLPRRGARLVVRLPLGRHARRPVTRAPATRARYSKR